MGKVQTPIYQKTEHLRSDSLAGAFTGSIKMPNQISDLRGYRSQFFLSTQNVNFSSFNRFCDYFLDMNP